jgi:hypothetical protein
MRPQPRAVRRPPYDLAVSFRVNDETIVRIAQHVDSFMDWSGRPASPASRGIVEHVLGLMELKAAAEARRSIR